MQLALHNDNIENKAVKWSFLLPKYFSSIRKGLMRWTGIIGVIVFFPLILIIFSPIIILCFITALRVFPKFAQKIAVLNEELKDRKDELAWENIEALEKELDYYERIFSNLIAYKKTEHSYWIDKLFSSTSVVLANIKEAKATLRSKYTLSTSEYFTNDKELAEYLKSIEGLTDVWDYPTSKEDYKEVFDSKK